MKSIVFLSCLAITLLSATACFKKEKEEKPGLKVRDKAQVDRKPVDTENEDSEGPNLDQVEDSIDWQEIRFADVSLFVERMEGYWQDNYKGREDVVQYAFSDTLQFELYAGDWFYDKQFYFSNDHISEVKLYEREVIHVGIDSDQTMDVPFCVLAGWKEWETEWKEVVLSEVMRFNEAEDKSPMEMEGVTPEGIREQVMANCGERWYGEFQGYNTLEEMGAALFTSEFHFKIVGKDTETGQLIEKYIVFITPTHC